MRTFDHRADVRRVASCADVVERRADVSALPINHVTAAAREALLEQRTRLALAKRAERFLRGEREGKSGESERSTEHVD